MCLTILNITTGTTNGTRKTRQTRCSPGVAQTHTSEAGEAAALQSPSRPSRAFQPTEVAEEKLEFLSKAAPDFLGFLLLLVLKELTGRQTALTFRQSEQTTPPCLHFLCLGPLTSPQKLQNQFPISSIRNSLAALLIIH